MLKRTLLLLVFGLSLAGCNLSASSTQSNHGYEPYMTHITIIPANLPPAWQQLPLDLLTNFDQAETDFISNLIEFDQSNQQIHFYWTNPPGQPTQQTMAINQTSFENDASVPSQLTYRTQQKFTFFHPATTNLPTPLIPANAAISIHHLTSNLPPINQTDTELTSISHLINHLSQHLPLHIHNHNNQLTLGEDFNQTPQDSFNYSFSPSPSQYLDTLMIEQISTELSPDYIDIISLNPQLAKTISISTDYTNFSYTSNEISQQIFNQIRQILSDQGTYQVIDKTLPDNSETSIHQITPNIIDIDISNQELIFYNLHQEIRYINLKDNQITISNSPDPDIMPIVSYPYNPILKIITNLPETYQFNSFTLDPNTNNGIIKL